MTPADKRYRLLCKQAGACTTCPGMAGQSAVLGPGNGNLNAGLLFVAEAPGRLGGASTGIPISGDQSGRNFETLIAHIGLTRDDMFITNAVLCNPLANGNNRRPTAREISHCSGYLQAVLDLIRPRLVVTLGTVGLDALNRLLGTRYRLGDTVGRPLPQPAFTLLPLYHPSPRVTHWKRPLPRQKRDFQQITRLLNALS